ncbi:DDE-type integrase/transposase/recombinase, partial [Rhodovulum sulfidophilum]|nr:DDE-type integrase/transposase/recombinase [Rhodovulum sulfidophilum]
AIGPSGNGDADLRDQGIRFARKTVVKLMKDHDIRPPRKGRRLPRTIDSRHNFGIAPNLLRRTFEASEPDRIWLADISHVPTGPICHSDRGIQYASGDCWQLLDAWKTAASMSRKGDCLDNAPMESFFGSLKNELVPTAPGSGRAATPRRRCPRTSRSSGTGR